MTAINQNFTLTKGDSFTVRVDAVKQDKTPLNPVSGTWEVRENETDSVFFTKSELNIMGNTVFIELTPEESDKFEQPNYFHWLRIIDQSGKKSTISKGVMKVER